jgi:hypothetical protein
MKEDIGMSKEVLQSKTCKELRDLAKELNILGRWEMTKGELIEAILGAEVVKNTEETTSAKDEIKVDNQAKNVEVEDKDEKESAGNENYEVNMEQKMQYIEGVEIGALVAFRLSSGKVKSAKVIRKSTKNRKLKLETDYGAVYIVPYEDIIWVRTGKRWPKGVYKLLKGLVDSNERGK